CATPSYTIFLPLHDALPIFEQIDHRLAPCPALAMHMLEEVERQRARPVEEQHEPLLQVVEVARRKLAEQRAQRGDRSAIQQRLLDRKSTRLNSSHVKISYAV